MIAKSGPKRHHQRGANQPAKRNIQRDDQRVTWNDICVGANCSWATKPRPTVTEMLCLADNNQCQLFTRSVCFQTSQSITDRTSKCQHCARLYINVYIYMSLYINLNVNTKHVYIYIYVYIYTDMYPYTHVYIYLYLSIHLSVYLSIYLSFHAASNTLPIHYCNRALSQPPQLRTTPAVQHQSWLPKKSSFQHQPTSRGHVKLYDTRNIDVTIAPKQT